MPAPDQATTRELTTDELGQRRCPSSTAWTQRQFARQHRLCPPPHKILAALAAEFSQWSPVWRS
jgi:hypothetical protein